MKIRPLGDKVLVLKDASKDRTEGGILLPDRAQEKPQRGTVIAVGPGAMDDKGFIIPMTLRVGDRVLFGRWGGQESKDLGEDTIILSESEILGVIEEE